MNKIRSIGIIYLIIAVFGVIGYAVALFKFTFITLMISAFLLVSSILGLLGWVGFIMLTTPDTDKKNGQ